MTEEFFDQDNMKNNNIEDSTEVGTSENEEDINTEIPSEEEAEKNHYRKLQEYNLQRKKKKERESLKKRRDNRRVQSSYSRHRSKFQYDYEEDPYEP